MDDKTTPTPLTPLMFDKPLEGLQLKPLLDWNDNNTDAIHTDFVAGSILGIVPSLSFRYDSYRGLCMPATKWWALVCKSTDTQVADVTKDLRDARERITGWQAKAVEFEKMCKDASKEREELLKSVNAQAQRIDGHLKALREKDESLRRLETDLAAVKKHIGERAFAEALAATGK